MARIYLSEILDEVLGVPKNIIETADKVYDGVVKTLLKFKDTPLLDREGINFVLRDPEGYDISDYSVKQVNISINAQLTERDEIEMMSMGFSFKTDIQEPSYKVYKVNVGDYVNLSINLAVPGHFTWGNVINFFQGPQKANLVSSLAHELKHSYDKFKKQTYSSSSIINYKVINDLMVAAPGIGEFMFFKYFTDVVEGLVRPVEIAAYLKQRNATKKDFLDIIKETEVYKNAKKAQAFTYEGMINEMVSDPRMVPSIDSLFQREGVNVSGLSDTEKVEKFLELHFERLKDHSKQLYKMELHRNDPLMRHFIMLGVSTGELDAEKGKAMKDFSKEIERYSGQDYKKFYKREIAKINFAADKIIRKIAKLYDYI